MAEDPQPDPAEQPDEGEYKPEPYRLGGSGGAGPWSDPGLRRAAGQPAGGAVLLPGGRGHERPRRAVAERLRDAGRRRVDVLGGGPDRLAPGSTGR